jgi:phosphopantetheine attachment domain protein
MTKEYVTKMLTEEIATELNTTPDEIDEHTSFMRMGISSIQALKIINRLRKTLSIKVNPVALFQFDTIDEISSCLAEEYATLL